MATLTEASYYTRRIVVGILITFGIVIVSPFIFSGIRTVYLAIHPPPPTPATKGYGRLPNLVFVSDKTYKPTFKLETINGKLPDLPKLGKVFVVEINRNRLLELDRMRARAATLGFKDNPREVDERTYVFDDAALPRELAVDLIYNNYGYKYKWQGDSEYLKARNVPGKDQAQAQAKSFFQSLGLLENDLANGVITYTFLAARDNGQMVLTSSLSEANFVRVDLFRNDIDKFKVVTTDWDTSAINVIFSGQTDQLKQVAGANYNYSRITPEGFQTYVLKTADQAWSELSGGNGNVVKKAGQNVVVRKAYMAYFESNQPQQFMQPVFVFEGDNGFAGYVSAVDPKYPDRPSGN